MIKTFMKSYTHGECIHHYILYISYLFYYIILYYIHITIVYLNLFYNNNKPLLTIAKY